MEDRKLSDTWEQITFSLPFRHIQTLRSLSKKAIILNLHFDYFGIIVNSI
jgi:hypothetical protein